MLKITKFGGSSVANAEQFRKVKAIVEADPARKYVVVSAPGKRDKNDNKITDLLYLLDAHRQYHVDGSNVYKLIRQRFIDIKTELGLKTPIEEEMDLFYQSLSKYSQDAIVSRGEYWCAKLMAEYLGYDFVDAQDVIRFKMDKSIDMKRTTEKLLQMKAAHDRFVFPGFYGSNAADQVQVFSRGGGDITGAILARCLEADVYENWTDVSGFLMADPSIVQSPKPITHITYTELRELSYMGASVLHEEAIFPVKEANIPIHILNTNHPEDSGTIIQEHTQIKNKYSITGIAGKRGFLSIYIYKKHMSNEVGFIRRVLSILEAYNISVEHIPTGIDSFSIVVVESDIRESLYEILARIKQELKPDEIHTDDDLALVSTVGKSMAEKSGMAGKLFGALGEQKINIKMIAQSSDEINITVAVKASDFKRSIRAIYNKFVTEEDIVDYE